MDYKKQFFKIVIKFLTNKILNWESNFTNLISIL